MSTDQATLDELWRVRNAAVVAMAQTEDLVRRAVRSASTEELAAMLDTYSPARAIGPEWTRTFEPLIERLWTWRDDATLADLAGMFRARGPAWAAVANALSPENGAAIRAALRHPAWARMPAFGML